MPVSPCIALDLKLKLPCPVVCCRSTFRDQRSKLRSCMGDFKDRSVLVTGSGTGVGLGIA